MEMGTEARAIRVRLEDRLPSIDRVLREAGRPLSAKEIALALGWTSERGRASTLAALRRYPQRYQPVKGQKRNECWVLHKEEAPGTGAAPLAPEPAAAALVPRAPEEPAQEVITPVPATRIELIRKAIAEWKEQGFDQVQAVFALGRIEGLLDQPSENPAAE